MLAVLVLIIIMELLLLLIPLLTSALSFSTAAPLRPERNTGGGEGEQLGRGTAVKAGLHGGGDPGPVGTADSADSAQTVATSAATEASTVLSFLSAPVLLLSSQADTTPAIAAASWATETAAWACAMCSRSSSRLFLLRLPAMGMLSIKYPLRIALMCPMFSCSFSVETKRFCQFTSLC